MTTIEIHETAPDPILVADVLVTPKFLTRELAQKVVKMKFQGIWSSSSGIGRMISDKEREDGWSVSILVPGRKDGSPSGQNWPRYPIVPVCLYEAHVGNPDKWPYPFRDIAECKALQIWDGRSDGRSIAPHLLFPSDTPYWGGAKQDGVVVACSGFKEEVDRLVSVEILSELIKYATMSWELSQDREDEVNFLT